MESMTSFRDWLDLNGIDAGYYSADCEIMANLENAIMNPGKVYGGYYAKMSGRHLLLCSRNSGYVLRLVSEKARDTFLAIIRGEYCPDHA